MLLTMRYIFVTSILATVLVKASPVDNGGNLDNIAVSARDAHAKAGKVALDLARRNSWVRVNHTNDAFFTS